MFCICQLTFDLRHFQSSAPSEKLIMVSGHCEEVQRVDASLLILICN